MDTVSIWATSSNTWRKSFASVGISQNHNTLSTKYEEVD